MTIDEFMRSMDNDQLKSLFRGIIDSSIHYMIKALAEMTETHIDYSVNVHIEVRKRAR